MAVTFDPGRDHFASQNVEAGQVDGNPIDMCFMDQLSSFDESASAASGPLEACVGSALHRLPDPGDSH
jgi:hypothetical protein